MTSKWGGGGVTDLEPEDVVELWVLVVVVGLGLEVLVVGGELGAL